MAKKSINKSIKLNFKHAKANLNKNNHFFKAFEATVQSLIPDLPSHLRDALGTSIPSIYNGNIGEFIMNPSTVSLTTFKRMIDSDPNIADALDTDIALIVNSIGEYYHENKEVQELCRKSLERLPGGKNKLIKNMLTAIGMGYFLGEKVVDKEHLKKTGEFLYKKVTPLPPITTIFAVEPDGEIKDRGGIFQYIVNSYAPGYQNMITQGTFTGNDPNIGIDPLASAGDYDYPLRSPYTQLFGLQEIPREKCIHYTNDGINSFNNPYDRSKLRRIYNLYLLKYGIQNLMTVALQNRAMPEKYVFADGQQQIYDDFGNTTNCYEVALNVESTQVGTGTKVYPGMQGTHFDVKTVDTTGDLNLFNQILEYIDKNIYKGLGIYISVGDNNSYASSYMHDSIHSRMVSVTAENVTNCLIHQFIKDIIESNFDKSEYKDFGYFKERSLTLDDKLKYVKLFESAINSGIGSPKLECDKEYMRDIINLPFTAEKIPQPEQANQITNQRETKDIVEQPYAHDDNW
jgi:hypothetical protein